MTDEPLIDTRHPETKTLRDEFAGQVMQAMIVSEDAYWPFDLNLSTGDDQETTLEIAARTAYYIADAMIRERAK